jgi:transposase
MAKRVYRAVSVKKVSLATTIQSLAAGPVWAGVDIAKEELVTVLRDSQGQFQGPWKTRQPSELRELVAHFVEIARHRPLVVAMESTGTYGDALRQALTDAGLAAHRVSGKAVKDYAEIFDGVPSNHDGKDAGIIAELAGLGKSRPWPSRARAAWEGELAFWVEWLDSQQQIKQMWLGRLEGLLARHWPEATRIVQLTSATLQRVLAHYGGPRGLGEDPQGVAQLKAWGGQFLSEKKRGALWESARSTVGVRMTEEDQKRMRRYAEECRRAEQEIRQAKQALTKLAEQDATLQRQAKVVGAATACVLWVAIGAVTEYTSGGAYRKALGLNLKERSSGKFKGKLKISKRGPGLARRWLYFAALRIVQKPPVRGWYEAKKARDGQQGLKAVIGVMRKLALALYAVGAEGKEFELQRLFPGRRQGGKAKTTLNT